MGRVGGAKAAHRMQVHRLAIATEAEKESGQPTPCINTHSGVARFDQSADHVDRTGQRPRNINRKLPSAIAAPILIIGFSQYITHANISDKREYEQSKYTRFGRRIDI